MKAIGYIFWVVLLVLGTAAQAADTEKSPAVLLQEALYQEQTAGDLDKAIELYSQVLDQAAEVERLAARATYQLGLCYLKKGDQTIAVDYFQKAVTNYPNQTSVVKKAQAELDKIAPENGMNDNQLIFKDSFEQGGVSPIGWEIGAPVEGVSYIWDKNTGSDGTASLCLKKDVEKYFPIAQWTRKTDYIGNAKLLYVSAQVRARKAYKAVIDALFLDDQGEWIKHEWVSYIGAKETGDPPANHNWTEYAGTVEIPENTKTIVIGLQMYGPGTVWFDALEAAYANADEGNDSPQKMVEAFLRAVLSGDRKVGASFILAGKGIIEDMEEFQTILNGQAINVESVYGDTSNALVITSPIHADHERFGPLVFTLEKLRDAWFISDIDVETAESTRDEITRFLDQYPSAKKIDTIVVIHGLIKELSDPDAPQFVALNELIDLGQPAVEPLIEAMQTSNNWQIPKALGVIGNKRAVGPLIEKWQAADFSPMNEVIAEALTNMTGKPYGSDLHAWQDWWDQVKDSYTPQATIQNFMQSALQFDVDKAMNYVAPDSHDFEDIKEVLENPAHPFYELFQKADASIPVDITRADISDTMCEAAWTITLKEDFSLEGLNLKAGDTFELDGNLHKYDDKWLITGI